MTTTKIVTSGFCPKGWIPETRLLKCYKPFIRRVPYEIAAQKCRTLNATLLTINSRNEDFAILNMIVDGEPWFRRGGSLILGPKYRVKGASPERILVAPNGRRDDLYTNFAAGEPNNAGASESCVEVRMWQYDQQPFSNYSGLWNDYDCGWERSSFICELPLSAKQL
ncbi:unnamed protein product, partial [Mesorhabditis spiculigera]